MGIEGKSVRATHVAWFLHYGVWPSELLLQALHHCDNPGCVNVVDTEHHVFLGTIQDNQQDASRKGRLWSPRGELHPSAALTEQDIVLMRELYASGQANQIDLAQKFGVTQPMVSRIILRKSWSHVGA